MTRDRSGRAQAQLAAWIRGAMARRAREREREALTVDAFERRIQLTLRARGAELAPVRPHAHVGDRLAVRFTRPQRDRERRPPYRLLALLAAEREQRERYERAQGGHGVHAASSAPRAAWQRRARSRARMRATCAYAVWSGCLLAS